jgi:hypothetical protein
LAKPFIARETRAIGTAIVAVQMKPDGLHADWTGVSGDGDEGGKSFVASVLERQARIHMELDGGHYWLQLRVVPR